MTGSDLGLDGMILTEMGANGELADDFSRERESTNSQKPEIHISGA